MQKTSFLALLGKNFPEKLSGLSVKGGGNPPFPLSFFEHNDCPLRKIPLKSRFLGPKTLFFAFFHAFLALFGLFYGLLGPFLTLFNAKKPHSFLALLGKNFPEKLNRLSVKGGGHPPLSAKGFLEK